MHQYLQFLLLGLGVGGAYTLIAQGLVVVYRASGILNFSHGAFAMAGAFIWYEMDAAWHWPFVASLLVAVMLTAVLGGLVYLIVLRPLRHKSALSQVFATLGVLIILQAVATIRYGDTVTTARQRLPADVWVLGKVRVAEDRMIVLAIALVLTALLSVFYRRTRVGLATVATAQDADTVASLGWSPDVLSTVAWAMGSGLAALAGILLVPLIGLQVTTFSYLVIAGMAAALLGGFSSVWLTLAGGVLLGVLQSVLSIDIPQAGRREAIPFLVIVAVLVFSGKALPLRSHLLHRLPSVGSGRITVIGVLAPSAVLLLLVYLVMDPTWVDATSMTLTVAIMILSVVVLTGYAGQLSLGPYALGGVAALASGRLVAAQGWPFEAALVIGVLAAVVSGLVFALPALRTRGITLAVVTLGLGLAILQAVFSDGAFTGGVNGTQVGPQTLFGIDVDPVVHPERWTIVALVGFVICVLVVSNVRRGLAGRRLIAVRTNERAAASLGVSVFGAKLYAFGLSSAVAGVAGVLLGFRAYSAEYDQFNPLASIEAVTLGIVGGVGFLAGPLFGALLAPGTIGSRISVAIFGPGHEPWLAVISGVFLIFMLRQDANGMASHNARAFRRFRERVRPRSLPESPPLPEAARRRVVPRTLEVRDLRVRFGGVVALDGASLRVGPGEVVGLIGPNGAGKTTFVDAVTGYVRPSSGQILLDDTAVGGLRAHQRARLGLTRSFQSLELFDDITVFDNLRAASDRHNRTAYLASLMLPDRQALSPAAVAAVREFNLEAVLDKRAEDLPYGQRRLVAIARAVATEASVLLLDEPAAGLDDFERDELGRLVRRLADEWGIAVLVIEHDMSLIMRICDRIHVLEFGVPIASGTPAEVRSDPAVIAAYLGEAIGPDSADTDLVGSSIALTAQEE